MEDVEIIQMFFNRSEMAIEETKNKYGSYIRKILCNILANYRDIEEVENDTYLAMWDTIPPKQPDVLKHYISRIARNLAFKKFDYNLAGKRKGNAGVVLDELEELVSGDSTLEDEISAKMLGESINNFITTLPVQDKKIFVLRYYYIESLRDIATRTHLSERRVKYRLSVMRKALKEKLIEEGYMI